MKKIVTILLLHVLTLSFSGCSVVMALKKPDKKNMAVFSQGISRENVLVQIGPPLSSEKNGPERVDIYTFVQGHSRSWKVSRALFYGVADFFTFFIWELVAMPAELVMNGSHRSVKVVYDDQDKIEDVTFLSDKG